MEGELSDMPWSSHPQSHFRAAPAYPWAGTNLYLPNTSNTIFTLGS